MNKGDGKFDPKKFADTAFEHLKRENLTPLAEYARTVRPFLAERGLENPSEALLLRAVPTIRERARTLKEAANALDFYFREPPELDEKARDKLLGQGEAARLAEPGEGHAELDDWRAEPLEAAARGFCEAHGIAMKDIAQAARVAVTGRSASPPLFEVMAVLGKERSLARLARAPELARK